MTGQPPFVGETPFKTVMQVIHDEPVRPSALRGGVDRDLETICLKCLEKDPARRYASAEHLAQDLARYSQGEPILARPVSSVERIRKWVRRKPWAAAVLAVSTIGLISLIVGGIAFNTKLSHAYGEVELQRNLALEALDAESEARQAAIRSGQQAEASARESRRRLVDNYVNNGLQLLGDNRPLGALPWFAEAIKLEQDPRRSQMHRRRFVAARSSCPQPVDTWLNDSRVRQVYFDATGQFVAASSGSREIIVRDLQRRTMIAELNVPGQLLYFEPAPDFSRLVTVSISFENSFDDFQNRQVDVRVWTLPAGDPPDALISFMIQVETGSQRNHVSWAGQRVAHVDAENPRQVLLYDLASGQPAGNLELPADVQLIRFDGFGKRLVVVADGIRVWDIDQSRWVFESDQSFPRVDRDLIAFSRTQLVIAEDDLRLIELASGQTIGRFQTTDTPRLVAVDPDGQRVLLAMAGGRLEFREPQGGLVHVSELAAQINEIKFAEQSGQVLVSTENSVWLFETSTGRQIGSPIPSSLLPLNDADITRDGSRVAIAGGSGMFDGQGCLRVWSTEPQETIYGIPGWHGGEDTGQLLTVSPTGRMLASQIADPSGLALFRLADESVEAASSAEAATVARPLSLVAVDLDDRESQIVFLRWNAGGTRLLEARQDGRIAIRDVSSFAQPVLEFGVESRPVDAGFSPDGNRIAVAVSGTTPGVRIFDSATAAPVTPWLSMNRPALAMAFTGENESLVVVSGDLMIRAWDPGTGQLQWERNAEMQIRDVDIRADQNLLVLGGDRLGGKPGRVALLNLSTGADRCQPLELDDPVVNVTLSRSPDLFLTGRLDGTIEVRATADGRLMAPPLNHPDQVNSATFDEPVELLLTVCRDRKVRLFDWRSGTLVAAIQPSPTQMTEAGFVPRHSLVALSGMPPGLWQLPSGNLGELNFPDEAIYLSASQISDRGVVATAPRERLFAVLNRTAEFADTTWGIPEPAVETAPGHAASDDIETPRRAAFYEPLSPGLQASFPDLPVPLDPGRPIRLAYHPVPGQSRSWSIQNDTELNLMGVKSRQTQVSTVTATCQAETEYGYQMMVQTRDTQMQMDTPGGSFLVDSANPENNRAAPIFRPLVEIMKTAFQATAEFEVNAEGLPLEFRPPREIVDQIESTEGVAAMGISAESVSVNFLAMFTQVPDQPVRVGDRWPVDLVVSLFDSDDTRAEATFLGVTGIDRRPFAVFRLEAAASGKPFESEMLKKMDNKSDAIVYFDLEDGCIDRVVSHTSGVTTLNINNTILEQKVESSGEIKRIR